MCGEKMIRAAIQLVEMGSPPRVRGKAISCAIMRSNVGITPACAGKRPAFGLVLIDRKDHPRVCGEKTAECMTHSHR